jgi:CcmD family protein
MLVIALSVIAFVGLSFGSALAQDPGSTPTDSTASPTSDASKTPTIEFKVKPGQRNSAPKEDLPGWPFLYGAYACIWLAIFGYVFALWLKQRKLDSRIVALDKRLDELDKTLDDIGQKKGKS